MKNENYTTTYLVDQTAAEVFKAILCPRKWWSEQIEGSTSTQGDEFTYQYKDVHISKMKLEEIVTNEKVVWRVLQNHFNFIDDNSEWVNTRIIFDISEKDNQTQLHFTHEGLVPQYECYDVCHDAWRGYITGSLKSLIRTGKGQPNAREEGLNTELIEKWNLPKK